MRKKGQSAGTVRNRPQHLHEPSKSLIKRTEAAILTLQQMQWDTSYAVHSELGFRASPHDTRLCISSEVSEYFRVIKITKLKGGVFVPGSTPRKAKHLTVHSDRFAVENNTWGIGAVALGDSVPHSRVEINQGRTNQNLIH